MQERPVARRTQFSSCDGCRRSRVACDAASRPSADGASGSCSRCSRRNRQCTFDWINNANRAGSSPTKSKVKKRAARRTQAASSGTSDAGSVTQECEPAPASASTGREGQRSRRLTDVTWYTPNTTTSDQRRTEAAAPSVQSPLGDSTLSPTYAAYPSTGTYTLSDSTVQWLQDIYRDGWESVFGSWMGRFSCPFVFGRDSPVDKHISMMDLCRKLDHWMADILGDNSDSAPPTLDDQLMDKSLWGSIAAFAARWLPVAAEGSVASKAEKCVLVASLWRDARRDMLRLINRPSYRSMLALYLFALTPIPVGVSDDEAADGISGLSCVHAALQQIQTLRARHRALQFSGSMVKVSQSASSLKEPQQQQPSIASPQTAAPDTSNFLNAESIAYWAALTWDTSASLTLNCRPLLSSGLFGFEQEIPWRLVHSCSKVFLAEDWSRASGDMTDDRADQIVASAAAFKLLGWKLTANFKESLRDGHDEAEVKRAFAAVVESTRQFDSTYRGPLEACQRRLPFLSQTIRLRWYSLMLHYHLSILMLVDMIEAASRADLLTKQVVDFNTDAENVVMNTLAFGLHSIFTLRNAAPRDDQQEPISVPIVSIDPYPHHVVAGVQLLRKATARDLGSGKITHESYENLRDTLEDTLKALPQSSKAVWAARSRGSV